MVINPVFSFPLWKEAKFSMMYTIPAVTDAFPSLSVTPSTHAPSVSPTCPGIWAARALLETLMVMTPL